MSEPTLYNYTVMHRNPDGSLRCIHGSCERHPPLATNDDYNDFMDRLSESLGIPRERFVVLSLNRL